MYIAICILAVIAVLVVIVAMRPAEFGITRSATISAPPAVVFAQVNDFHKWDVWSPWAKMDPRAKNTFSGAPAGKGAIFSWVGNKKVGEGRMEITESRPSELILIDLEFLKPFPARNVAEFTFQPQGDQTLVTWSMSGRNKLIPKIFCMVMNMDKMVGGQFEKGLIQIKAASEAAATAV